MRAACDAVGMPRSVPLPLRAVVLAAALAAVGACARHEAGEPGNELSGVLIDSQLDEISGLAASRRHPGVLWMIDDGGNPERLFAVSDDGERLATFRIEGVTKTDWEDIASFRVDLHESFGSDGEGLILDLEVGMGQIEVRRVESGAGDPDLR